MELAPRSMTRATMPVCLPWWKFSDSVSAWPKVSSAERASACCETGVKMASRSSGVALEMKRSSTQPAARPMKTANRVCGAPLPFVAASIAWPISTGA